MFEQTGKGILEKLKGASINLEEIPAPITNEAMAIYDAFLKKIEDAGVPITEPRAFLSVGEAGEREAEGEYLSQICKFSRHYPFIAIFLNFSIYLVGMEEDLGRALPSNDLPSTSDEVRPL